MDIYKRVYMCVAVLTGMHVCRDVGGYTCVSLCWRVYSCVAVLTGIQVCRCVDGYTGVSRC